MFEEVRKALQELVGSYSSSEDILLFKNKELPLSEGCFSEIVPLSGLEVSAESSGSKNVAYVDGGQAEIISVGNFCLSFIRVAGVVFSGKKRGRQVVREFYVLSFAQRRESLLGVDFGSDLDYVSKLFPVKGELLISEEDLTLSSMDASIRTGSERAPIVKVANVARRFAELQLAKELAACDDVDFVLLDGMLDASFRGEEKLLSELELLGNVCALAKSSSLFTANGNSPVVLLSSLGPSGCWNYFVDGKTSFVKLHTCARHVFRFEGNRIILPFLLENACDPIFLGYPYGLIFADRIARVSNAEKDRMKMQLLLNKENAELVKYLQSSDAHSILDRIS